MDVVLEREKNYGNIQIAKSSVLVDSLRVFPKDIPVPGDMLKFSLNADILPAEKEDKKSRKPRKSNVATVVSTAGGSSPTKQSGKGKVKNEEGDVVEKLPVAVFAVKSEPTLEMDFDDVKVEGTPKDKKNSRLTSGGRRSVADKVAEAVKKTYAAKSDFATKSAQMIKLAAAVVNKQVEEPPKHKGPMLVLAETIKSKSSNGELSHAVEPHQVNSEEKSNVGHGTGCGIKRRGRPPASLGIGKDEDIKEEKDEDDETNTDKTSTCNEQGLTRSKRDKVSERVN